MERPRGADDRAVFAAGFESQSGGLSRPTSIVSCPTVRSNAAILASYSEIVIAAASSAFSSPRSYWLSTTESGWLKLGKYAWLHAVQSYRPEYPRTVATCTADCADDTDFLLTSCCAS